MWMQYGCKVYVDSSMASNGPCFKVTLTILKNHLLEVGLTQKQETMAHFQMFITVGLFLFIMCEDPHDYKNIEITFGWGLGTIWLHTTLEDPWSHYMILKVSWDGLWTLSLGSHNFMVTALGLCVEWPLVLLRWEGSIPYNHISHPSNIQIK